jgi:enoyl-CoA hydratase/carnithine racemase
MNDELIRKHEGHYTHLTLNRPQKANALSAALVEALRIGFLTHVAAPAEWPALITAARTSCELLTPAAAAALHQRTVADTRAADMAALAASVSLPGLKERIRLYRETGK